MTMVNAVIDLSHHNFPVDFLAARRAGMLGVLHKATQGDAYQDPLYAMRRSEALAAGLLWGAYHFGIGQDGTRQAEFFLRGAEPEDHTLLALDLEENPAGASMNLEQARAFVVRVRAASGRWPGIYGGRYLKQLLREKDDPVLAKCWLWLAHYGPRPVVPPNWPGWTLWQYTDGVTGPPPYEVAGIGRCDRDQFQGTEAQLGDFWRKNGENARL